MELIKIIANTILTSLTFKFLIPRIMIPLKGDVLMSKNITKNIILTTTLLLLGTVLPQNQKPVFSFYSEAKAYSIGQDETNINELIKYYTQPHFSFSNKWLYQYDNGNIYVELKRYSWSAHISLWGAESWGNINQLKDRYVDVFGLKDKDTDQLWWSYERHLQVALRQPQNLLIKLIIFLCNTKINYKRLLVRIKYTKAINQY